MEKLKIGSDCSGVGAFNQALKRLGVEYKEQFACDLDRFARQTFIHNYGTKKDVEILNTAECKRIDAIYMKSYDKKKSKTISEEDWKFVRENEERIARSFSFYYPWDMNQRTIPSEPSDWYISTVPCFTGDTLINTDYGFKEIRDISIGDVVLTHRNRYKKVVDFGSKKAEIYKLSAQGIIDTETTSNHRYYVRKRYRKWNNEIRRSERLFTNPEWVSVENLTENHFIGISIPKVNNNPYNIDEDTAYVLGRYVADGWIRDRSNNKWKSHAVILAIGKDKRSEISSKIKIEHQLKEEVNGASRLYIYSKKLTSLIDELGLGYGAINKRIPQSIINLPVEILKHFVNGYMDGDGHSDKNYFRATSVSKELIMGLQLCIAKIYRVNSNVKFVKTSDTTIIEGRIVNQRDYYVLEFRKEMKKQSVAIVIDDIIWYPIRSIEKTDKTDIVFDITVEDDHSFTANSAIVHNCQAFSIAGLRGGEKDKRGILFYSSHEYIQKNKPRFFIFENVKGLLSDSKEKGNEFGKTFNNWLSLLGGKSINGKISMFVHEDAVPYHIHWKIVNAKDRGVPQNRERVFIVGIRDDADNTFAWPGNIELKKKLKDVLESNVDEKYFLSEKMIKYLISKPRSLPFTNAENKNHSNCILASQYKMTTDQEFFLVKPEEEGLIQLNNPKHSTNRVFDPKGISPRLTTMTGGGRQPYVKVDDEEPIIIQRGRGFNKGGCHTESPPITSNSFQNNNHLCIPVLTPDRPEKRQNGRRFKEDGEPSFTLTAQDKHGVFDGVKIRRLTERECFRLMDFPDTFTWPVSSSQAYKQAGNSVVVQMYVDILEQFIKKM